MIGGFFLVILQLSWDIRCEKVQVVSKICSIKFTIFKPLAFFKQIAKSLACLTDPFHQAFAGIGQLERKTFLLEIRDYFEQCFFIKATKFTIFPLKPPVCQLKSVPRL